MSWFSDKVVARLIDVDKWGNAAIFGSSDKQTISAYSWELESEGKLWGRVLRPVIDWIFGNGHCQKAYQTWLLAGGPLS